MPSLSESFKLMSTRRTTGKGATRAMEPDFTQTPRLFLQFGGLRNIMPASVCNRLKKGEMWSG